MKDELDELVDETFDEILSVLTRALQGNIGEEAILRLAGTVTLTVARAVGEAARLGRNAAAGRGGGWS